MIFEGAWWAQMLKAIGGILVIAGFLASSINKRKGIGLGIKKLDILIII